MYIFRILPTFDSQNSRAIKVCALVEASSQISRTQSMSDEVKLRIISFLACNAKHEHRCKNRPCCTLMPNPFIISSVPLPNKALPVKRPFSTIFPPFRRILCCIKKKSGPVIHPIFVRYPLCNLVKKGGSRTNACSLPRLLVPFMFLQITRRRRVLIRSTITSGQGIVFGGKLHLTCGLFTGNVRNKGKHEVSPRRHTR